MSKFNMFIIISEESKVKSITRNIKFLFMTNKMEGKTFCLFDSQKCFLVMRFLFHIFSLYVHLLIRFNFCSNRISPLHIGKMPG